MTKKPDLSPQAIDDLIACLRGDFPQEYVKEAAAMLAALRDRADGRWRLFETAPKDGTTVLVYRKDAGVFEAHFVSPSEMIVSDDDIPAWFSTNGEDLTDDLPTHWIPLPAPPGDA